jgi:hypothetical protein
VKTALASVAALTDRVHAALSDGDWASAHALDVERRALLEQLLVHVAAHGWTEAAAALADLERRSRQLVGEVQHHRRRVLREASLLKTAHAAAGAYGNSACEPTIAGKPYI